jgi:hypothetical protein
MLAPGDSAEVLLSLTPGRYAVICWHRDHVLQGMGAEFTASIAPNLQPSPESKAAVVLSDYQISALSPSRGRQLLRIHNAGPSEHEFIVLRLAAERTLADFLAWRSDGEIGPAPAHAVAGTAALVADGEVWVDVDWAPGEYVLLCLLEDSVGTLHVTKGMSRRVVVGE